jgi:hypothetical protein
MAFSKVLQTIGFDINQNRIAELKNGLDRNGEMAMDGTWFDGLTMGGKSDRSS